MTPIVKDLPSDLVLLSGSHNKASEGMCVMEAVAFVAGEPHSDHPVCASEPIGAFLRSWNDNIPDDAKRTSLLAPLVRQLADSRSTDAVEEYRAFMAFDWLTRIYTPAWLDLLPECAADATALRALACIDSLETALAASAPAETAAQHASAAWSAAESAARSAAESAAWSAARSAAWSAAESAARSAAESAAEEALRPTVQQLELSALDLVRRMLAVTPETLPTGWVPPSQVKTAAA